MSNMQQALYELIEQCRKQYWPAIGESAQPYEVRCTLSDGSTARIYEIQHNDATQTEYGVEVFNAKHEQLWDAKSLQTQHPLGIEPAPRNTLRIHTLGAPLTVAPNLIDVVFDGIQGAQTMRSIGDALNEQYTLKKVASVERPEMLAAHGARQAEDIGYRP